MCIRDRIRSDGKMDNITETQQTCSLEMIKNEAEEEARISVNLCSDQNKQDFKPLLIEETIELKTVLVDKSHIYNKVENKNAIAMSFVTEILSEETQPLPKVTETSNGISKCENLEDAKHRRELPVEVMSKETEGTLTCNELNNYELNKENEEDVKCCLLYTSRCV